MDYGWIHVAIWFHLVQKQKPLTLIPLQLKWGTATKVTVSSKVGSWQSGVFHLVLEPLLDSFSNVELLKTVALIFHKMHLHWLATKLSLCIYYLLCSFPSCCQNSSGHKTFIGLLWHLVLGIWEWVFPPNQVYSRIFHEFMITRESTAVWSVAWDIRALLIV